MVEHLRVVSGICWLIAYALIIRRAHADRAYGMPITAAAANIAWEFIFAFVRPMEPPQLYVNIAWFALDAVIVFQCVRYGRREWAARLSAFEFYAGAFVVQGMAAALVWFGSMEFTNGHRYVAFGQNLMMSALFIALLLRRPDGRGQSVAIAFWKLVGTAAVSVYCVLTDQGSPLLNALFLFTLVLDAAYLELVRRARRRAA
jgi:hypothetical protein